MNVMNVLPSVMYAVHGSILMNRAYFTSYLTKGAIMATVKHIVLGCPETGREIHILYDADDPETQIMRVDENGTKSYMSMATAKATEWLTDKGVLQQIEQGHSAISNEQLAVEAAELKAIREGIAGVPKLTIVSKHKDDLVH
jgi:hypothetical protein